MTGHLRLLICAGSVAAITGAATADVVTHWNEVLQDMIRATGGPPCPIGRAVAMTQLAVYDAVNSIDRTHEPYLGFVSAPEGASMEAAVAGASHRVMSNLYPSQQAVLDAQLAASLAAIPDGPAKTDGLAVGHAAADAILAARANDHSADPMPYTYGTNPGDYVPTFPDFTQPPFSPGWGHVTPFAMTRGDQFRPRNGPLGLRNMRTLLRSREYAEIFNEAKSLGSLHSTARGDEGTRIAFFWANDVNGTYKPPGHLCHITEIISNDHHLSMVENARLMALVGLAMGDAGIVAWDAKYDTAIDFWRPITGIRLAGTDGNSRTTADPNWEPLNPFTPPFPAWISGHATFAGAHAGVMAEFFGTDHATFTIDSEDPFYNALPLHGPRTFHRFSDAARENAFSRIYLGVHWRFDATDGNAAGFALGHYIGQNFLRPICPADFNHDGHLNSHDFFDFVHALLNGDESADFNHDGHLDARDLFAFIDAYLAGC